MMREWWCRRLAALDLPAIPMGAPRRVSHAAASLRDVVKRGSCCRRLAALDLLPIPMNGAPRQVSHAAASICLVEMTTRR